MREKEKSKILLCLARMSESGAERKYVDEAFDTNWVVPLGPNVEGFEKDLEQWVNSPLEEACAKRVVALASGTAALHLALLACGVGRGDEVLCQSFTFCASSNPIVYLGAEPVFVDSEADSWNMDPLLLQVAVEDRIRVKGVKPKAIVVVHLYGMPARIDEIRKVADYYKIPLVEDAAEALGASYNGRPCGTWGDFGVFSFNGNKMITTSGGGALVCPDEEEKNKAMFYATQAREPYPYYQHEHIGYNYRMSNICAGIGRGQMTVLDEHIRHHRTLAEFYRSSFEKMEGFTFHDNPDEISQSNFWLSVFLLDEEVRVKGQKNVLMTEGEHCPNANVEALRQALAAAGIESRPLWKPLHLQPVYDGTKSYVNGVSESVFKRGLCIPSGPCVSLKDAERVVEEIRSSLV